MFSIHCKQTNGYNITTQQIHYLIKNTLTSQKQESHFRKVNRKRKLTVLIIKPYDNF